MVNLNVPQKLKSTVFLRTENVELCSNSYMYMYRKSYECECNQVRIYTIYMNKRIGGYRGGAEGARSPPFFYLYHFDFCFENQNSF